jgi:hypothetical protein
MCAITFNAALGIGQENRHWKEGSCLQSVLLVTLKYLQSRAFELDSTRQLLMWMIPTVSQTQKKGFVMNVLVYKIHKGYMMILDIAIMMFAL